MTIKVVLVGRPRAPRDGADTHRQPERGDRGATTPWRPRSCSNSGDTEKTHQHSQAVDDSVDDDGESVQLSLGTLPAGVTEGTHDSDGRVTITDDDVPRR